MNYKRRAVTAVLAALLCIIGAAFLFAITGEAEEEWRYAFDEDAQSMVNVLNTVGVCCLISVGGHILQACVFFSASDEDAGREATKKKEIGLIAAFIGAFCSIACAIIIHSSTGEINGEWMHSLDKEAQTVIKVTRWSSICIAVVDAMEWITLSLVSVENIKSDNIKSEKTEIISDGTGMVAGTVRCSVCDALMSNNAIKCLRCGTLLPGYVENQKHTFSAAMGNENQKMKKCVFCDEPMPEKQIFCGACGRRQD